MPKRLLVELLRVQPREAEVLAARLRSAGTKCLSEPIPSMNHSTSQTGCPSSSPKRTGLRRLGFWLNQPRRHRAYAGLHFLLSR